MNMTVGMASDHAGFELKTALKEYLSAKGYEVLDYGTDSGESVDYPDFAHPLANAVEQGTVSFGIAICGTGNGVCMTANKHHGVRGALCWMPEIAALAKQHNNANVLAMPARFISVDQAKKILEAYMNASFEGGRHRRRINKIAVK